MESNYTGIRVGGVYVKNDGNMIRTVESIADGKVVYRSFWSTGEYIETKQCEIGTFIDWIGKHGREANEMEIRRLQIENAKQMEMASLDASIRYYLHHASDKQLLEEVRRRGLNLN